MPSDPGLSGDTCIYSEAVSGDGGNHNPSSTWWLSPDISLTGPVSGPDKADPGMVNTCQVTFHRKSATSQCTFPGAESLTVELWVGNPSLVMTPNNPASAVRIDYMGAPLPLQGATGTQIVEWTPPTGLPPSDPQGPGHKCLIARVYPDNLTPSDTQFYLPDDQHVVQRNICVVPCGSSDSEVKQCNFTVTTVNPDAKNAQKVKVTATQDLEPSDHVKETVLRALKTTTATGGLSLRPANGFGLELNDFPEAVISGGGPGGWEAAISMEPGQLSRFNFFADLSGASSGDAYIFHLSQSAADGRVQGGLTIVMVASSDDAKS